MKRTASRRSILKYGAIGLVGSSIAFTASARTDETEDSVPSVHFEAQLTEGDSVVLKNLVTRTASVLFVTTTAFEVVGRERFPGGVEHTSHTIEFTEPLTESGPLHAILIERDGFHITGDTATVTLVDDDPADLTVEDQSTDGSYIKIAHLRTDVDVSVSVVDEDDETIGDSGVTFDAGDEVESFTIPLDEPLSSSQTLRVLLYESNGELIAEEAAHVTIDDDDLVLTVEDQTTDGSSIEIAHLRTDVDASVFVFDEDDETVGGSGVRFDAGDEVESLTVPLDEPLSSSQTVRVSLYESNAGLIAEEVAHITLDDLTVEDQTTDGTSIEIAHLRTHVDASVFVFDENGQEIGGSGVTFDAGDEVESFTVNLDETLSTSQYVSVTLYESNAGPIAEDTAHVAIE